MKNTPYIPKTYHFLQLFVVIKFSTRICAGAWAVASKDRQILNVLLENDII